MPEIVNASSSFVELSPKTQQGDCLAKKNKRLKLGLDSGLEFSVTHLVYKNLSCFGFPSTNDDTGSEVDSMPLMNNKRSHDTD